MFKWNDYSRSPSAGEPSSEVALIWSPVVLAWAKTKCSGDEEEGSYTTAELERFWTKPNLCSSPCCQDTGSFRPPTAFQRRSAAAGQVECPPGTGLRVKWTDKVSGRLELELFVSSQKQCLIETARKSAAISASTALLVLDLCLPRKTTKAKQQKRNWNVGWEIDKWLMQTEWCHSFTMLPDSAKENVFFSVPSRCQSCHLPTTVKLEWTEKPSGLVQKIKSKGRQHLSPSLNLS